MHVIELRLNHDVACLVYKPPLVGARGEMKITSAFECSETESNRTSSAHVSSTVIVFLNSKACAEAP